MRINSCYSAWIATFLLYTSAVLYVIPLCYSTSFWWMVFFVFPVFFSSVLLHKPTSLQGFIWGIITITGYSSSFIVGIFSLAHGSYVYRCIPLGMLSIYLACCSVLWFWCAGRLDNGQSGMVRLCIWGCTAWMYLLWMDYGCLAVCGRFEGLCIGNLLVPLIECPALLYWVPYLGVPGVLLMLLAGAISLVLVCVSFTRTNLFFVWLLCLFWVRGFFGTESELSVFAYTANRCVIGCRVIPQRFQVLNAPFSTARELLNCIDDCLHKYPDTRLIIFPESAVSDPRALVLFEQLCADASADARIVKPIHILIGTFAVDKGNYRNAVYWLYRGKLQQIMYKNHATPLTERMPKICDTETIRKLYFDTMPQVVPDIRARTACRFDELQCSGVLYICSELFFNHQPHDEHTGSLIIALCNDSWVSKKGAQQMYNCARFKALMWKRAVLYCTYRYQDLLTDQGEAMVMRQREQYIGEHNNL